MTTVRSGEYFGVTHTGRLEKAPPSVPDVVICRRVADFPSGPPAVATIAPCGKCGEPVAFNPAGRYLDKPRECMQCNGIVPDPL